MFHRRQFTRQCSGRHCCRHRRLVGILVLQILGGCGVGGGDNNASSAQPPPTAESAIHGRYVGTARIDGRDYFADAMLTQGGTIQLYIGGPQSDTETIQLASPEGSIYFSGSVAAQGGMTLGSGKIIGREPEDCGQSGSPSSRWCGRASAAQISIGQGGSSESGAISGEIIVDGESWMLDLIPWSGAYNRPARLGDLAGLYTDMVAPFARDGGLVVNIDANGRAFFQGFPYMCTGNGTFALHGDGNLNVFDVEMSIASCDYPYSLLNGEYLGLATISPSKLQGTDSNLRVWISRFSPQSSAVTMWGVALSGSSLANAFDIQSKSSIADENNAVTLHLQTKDGNSAISEGIGHLDFEVHKHGNLQGEQLFTVEYRTVQESAKSDKNFVPVSGKLSWIDGKFAVNHFSVKIFDDNFKEPVESFRVELRNPEFVALEGPIQLSSQQITISDNDRSRGGGSGGGGGSTDLLTLMLIAAARHLYRTNSMRSWCPECLPGGGMSVIDRSAYARDGSDPWVSGVQRSAAYARAALACLPSHARRQPEILLQWTLEKTNCSRMLSSQVLACRSWKGIPP